MSVCPLCRNDPAEVKHEEWTLGLMWTWLQDNTDNQVRYARCAYCCDAWMSHLTRYTSSIRAVLEFSEELRYQAAMADLAR